MLAASTLFEARQPRSLVLRRGLCAAVCEGPLWHSGRDIGANDGVRVDRDFVGFPTPLCVLVAAAAALRVLGNRPHDLVFVSWPGPACVRIVGTCTPQASAP